MSLLPGTLFHYYEFSDLCGRTDDGGPCLGWWTNHDTCQDSYARQETCDYSGAQNRQRSVGQAGGQKVNNKQNGIQRKVREKARRNPFRVAVTPELPNSRSLS